MSDYTQSIQHIQSLSTLDTALRWLELGVAAVPAQPKSKRVILHWRNFEQQLPSRKQLKHWFQNGVMNLALVCGTGGMFVLDFDDIADYLVFERQAGELVNTYTEITSRGMHLFYQQVGCGVPQTFRGRGWEILGAAHLVIAAPSIHPAGSIYTPVDPGQAIRRVETAELISLLSKSGQGQAEPVSGGNNAGDPAPIVRSGQFGNRDLLARIKDANPVYELANSLTRLSSTDNHHGRWWVGKCPFHQDRNPSFWVDAQRGLWGCYAPECRGHRGGDVINLFAIVHQVDLREAIHQLKGRLTE